MEMPGECWGVIEKIIRISRDFLLVGEKLHGMAFVGKYGAGFCPLPMDMTHKDRSAEVLTLTCRAAGADYVILLSEAWALRADSNQEEFERIARIAKTRESIENHPDRMDVVLITLETRQGFWLSTTQIKPLEGKARGFGDPKFDFSQETEGRFCNFLRGTTH